MFRVLIFILLFTVYAVYTAVVYSKGTRDTVSYNVEERADILKGKHLYQQYNCTACHQLYGLGGYLGPELTTAFSDPQRGELYLRAFLQAGGTRMPDFHFTKDQIDALISYLHYVDETAITYK